MENCFMKCMHCLVEFHESKREDYLGDDVDGGWAIFSYGCPACKRMNLFLVNGDSGRHPGGYTGIITPTIRSKIAVHPFGSNRPPCPLEVPENIASDYREACLVFPFSAKASAALSRRCLQNLLRDATHH